MINRVLSAGLGAAVVMASACAAHAADGPWLLHDAVGAPSNLKLSGSFRARYEVIDGVVRPGLPTHEDLIDLRTTLFAEYAAGPLRFGGEVWDSRIYDSQPGTSATPNEVNVLEPIQAYVALDLKNPLGAKGKASLQAGRFTMNIGSRRLVAADDYRNTTNDYTGLRGDLATAAGLTATAYVVTTPIRLPETPEGIRGNKQALDKETNDLLLWGALVGQTVRKTTLVEAGYVGFRENDATGRPTRDRELSTFTARVLRNPAPDRYDFEAETAWQTGSISSSLTPGAAKLDVAAGFVHLRAGYSLTDAWKSHLSVEYDWVEGDDAGPTYRRFDTLYGMRRADLAPGGLYNSIGRANVSAPGVRWETTPSPRWDTLVTYHPLWLASDVDSFSTTGVRDATGRSGDFAGHQLDTRLRYWLIPGQLRFETDYILLAKGRFLRNAPNAPRDAPNDQYLSLNLTCTF